MFYSTKKLKERIAELERQLLQATYEKDLAIERNRLGIFLERVEKELRPPLLKCKKCAELLNNQ